MPGKSLQAAAGAHRGRSAGRSGQGNRHPAQLVPAAQQHTTGARGATVRRRLVKGEYPAQPQRSGRNPGRLAEMAAAGAFPAQGQKYQGRSRRRQQAAQGQRQRH